MSRIIEQLIKAQLERDGKSGGKSTIIPLHCAQMREYGSRGGHIQFDCPQDDDANSRGNAILSWYKSNDLGAKMDYIFDVFVCWGEILWLILPDPSGDGYWIEHFSGGLKNPEPQYKVYYSQGGRDIDKVVIRYSYEKPNELGIGNNLPIYGSDNYNVTTRWVKLIITADTITTVDLATKPDLNYNYSQFSIDGGGTRVDPNPFAPIVPCQLSVNNPRQTGKHGTGDFHVFSSMIENHEQRLQIVDDNLETFGNPTLVTTRNSQEVTEAIGADSSNTWASSQGYIDGVGDRYSGSNFKNRPYEKSSKRVVGKIIGNVGNDERFGYIQVDPVSSDLANFIKADRELIHWCLGGVDPLGISTSATFGEIKTLFGRVQNTAEKKAESLYGKLGKLFGIAIANEEQKFKAAFIVAIANNPKLAKQIPNLPELSDEQCQQLYQLWRQGQIELNFQIVGLPPMGDRTVVWRFTREVYKPSTRDLLDLSIVGRNLREDGLNQEFVMGKLYPEMSIKEIQAATTGFSPRVVQTDMASLNSLLQFYSMALSMPGSDPNIPLAIELGIVDLIQTGMQTLRKELSYGSRTYTPAELESTPGNLSEYLSGAIGSSSQSTPTQSTGTTIPIPTGNA